MIFTRSTYIGVDPMPGPQGLAYAALDADRKLLALGQGSLSEVLAFIGGQQEALVAVNGPAGQPAAKIRTAEQVLAERELPVYHTPQAGKRLRGWMALAFQVRQHLREMGFVDYPAGEDAPLVAIEVVPEAIFRLWVEGELLPGDGLLGRLQRQLTLYDMRLPVEDPMDIFEEITRHRILQGHVPMDALLNTAELQSLAAAAVAWQAARDENGVERIGDEGEGQIILPRGRLM